MDLRRLDQRLAEIYSSRRWIVVSAVAAGTTEIVEQLRGWGADVAAVVANVPGIGDQPEGVPIILTETRGETLMDGFRVFEAAVEHPSAAIRRALDDIDPERTALIYGATFSSADTQLDRAVYGGRRPEWVALEDKMTIDALWDDLGVTRAPSVIVAVQDAPHAAPQLASELGTVWVADNSEGWHGGGEYLRWVRTDADVGAAVAWMNDHATHVRVMPFLDGTPCSVHGFASATDAAAFRPVEMVILRKPGESSIVYAGTSTLWDPPDDHRTEMRTIATRTADHLRRTLGYRGPFSIDGIMTADGFRPTELNARVSVGSGIQARAAGLPLGSLTRAMTAGDIDVSAQWIADEVVAAADQTRWCRVHMGLSDEPEMRRGHVRLREGRPEWCGEDEAQLAAEVGEGPGGMILQIKVDAERVEAGPSTAPLIATVAQFVSGEWGLGMGTMEAAPELVGVGPGGSGG